MIEEIKIDRLEELIQEMMKKIRDTYPTESREGNPITFDNGAAAPLVKCITEIHGSQSGSGTPSPDNIRPIVAYTEGEIEVRGKNLFDKSSAIPNHRVITLNGELEYSSSSYASDYTAVTPNTSYIMNFVYYTSANFGLAYYDANKVYISGERQRTQEGDTSFTFTTPNNCKYIRFTIGSDVGIDNVQLEEGSTVTTYEPYTSTTHTATFSQTIYKGNVDLVTGKVTAEWGYIASYDGETLPGRWISDRDEYAAGTTPTTGARVAYELESPTTITETVSNAPISSIHGYNYIESSTGEMELTYITEEFEALANVPVES